MNELWQQWDITKASLTNHQLRPQAQDKHKHDPNSNHIADAFETDYSITQRIFATFESESLGDL